MRWFRRRRRLLRCVFCGREEFEWPRSFTQAFADEHGCPDGRGHLYVDDPKVAAMVSARG